MKQFFVFSCWENDFPVYKKNTITTLKGKWQLDNGEWEFRRRTFKLLKTKRNHNEKGDYFQTFEDVETKKIFTCLWEPEVGYGQIHLVED